MLSLRSRSAALLVAGAFFAGTVGVPTLHLAFHALPHDHAGGEIHYHFDDDDDHAEAAEHHRDHHDHHDREPFDPHHGDGSSAHFSLAISDAAAATIVLTVSPGTPAPFVAGSCDSPTRAAHVSVQRFRGPPAAA
jgi:hypothetical protein